MQPKYVTRSTVGSSDWQIVNWDISPINLGIAVIATGTVNYSLEYTYEDPSGTYRNPVSGTPTAFPLTALASKTATLEGSITFPIAAWRLTINSVTGGSAQAVVIQAGIQGG